jgi:CheY-like chemotaxis protein
MEQNGKIRIAVADDEPVVRQTFVRLLELLGHNVVCSASNGAELVDHCSSEEVDMAFVDLDMPVMDGLAAAAEISGRGIPVVLISGHPDVYDVVVEHEPVVARLLKPTSIDDLRRAIENALASKR